MTMTTNEWTQKADTISPGQHILRTSRQAKWTEKVLAAFQKGGSVIIETDQTRHEVLATDNIRVASSRIVYERDVS